MLLVRRSGLLGISLLAGVVWASLASALPFRNGSFEQATVYPPPAGTYLFGSFVVLPPSPIVGWNFHSGGNLEYVGAEFWQHADGNHSVELNGTAAASISQAFDTIEGATYRVTFAMSGHPGEDGIGATGTVGRPLVKTLQVSVDGMQLFFSFNTTGITFADMRWVDYEFEFVATHLEGHSEVVFTSFNQVLDPNSSVPICRTGSGCYGPAIDNVRIVLVPEPSAHLLGLVALAAASALRTRAGSVRCARAWPRGRGSRASGRAAGSRPRR